MTEPLSFLITKVHDFPGVFLVLRIYPSKGVLLVLFSEATGIDFLCCYELTTKSDSFLSVFIFVYGGV